MTPLISEVFRFSTEGYSQEDIERICKEREEVKYQEVRDACAIFGITDVRFLSYDDKMLQVTMPMIDATAKVIRDVRPDLIITHYPQTCGNVTNHHGNAAKIALDGAALSGVVDFDDPNPAWRVPQFAFMLNPSDCMAFGALSAFLAVPNYFVDVTDVVDLKVRALDQMKSQQYAGQYARKSVESWNGVFGFFKGTSYCEGFVMNTSEVGLCCRYPITCAYAQTNRKLITVQGIRGCWHTRCRTRKPTTDNRHSERCICIVSFACCFNIND